MRERLAAERYERTQPRPGDHNGVNGVNGVRPRQLATRGDQIILRVPRGRDGAFSTELFACYQRSEQALRAGGRARGINASGCLEIWGCNSALVSRRRAGPAAGAG